MILYMSLGSSLDYRAMCTIWEVTVGSWLHKDRGQSGGVSEWSVGHCMR